MKTFPSSDFLNSFLLFLNFLGLLVYGFFSLSEYQQPPPWTRWSGWPPLHVYFCLFPSCIPLVSLPENRSSLPVVL